MKHILPLLAALSLITVHGPAVADGIITGGQVVFHGPFNLAEAYPCTPGSYEAAMGIAAPRYWPELAPAR